MFSKINTEELQFLIRVQDNLLEVRNILDADEENIYDTEEIENLIDELDNIIIQNKGKV